MTVQVQRVSDRVIVIGNPGLEVRMPGGGAAVNWWDPNNEGLCVWCAYQPKGAASFAASLLDLSGNGNNAGDPGGAATPVWDAVNGWTGDGAADYLITAFIPQNDQSQSALVQFTNHAGGGFAFGMSDGAAQEFTIRPSTGVAVQYDNGSVRTVAPPLAAGNLGVAGNQGYRNGVAEGGAIGAWGGASASSVYIFCRNGGGVPAVFMSGSIQAIAFYDCILTAPQVLAIATAMAAL